MTSPRKSHFHPAGNEHQGLVPPFPHQGFSITGEEAAFLFHLIRRQRPRLIMELGSGSSTVLFAAALRANGGGRIISVEHDGEHVERTRTMLRARGPSRSRRAGARAACRRRDQRTTLSMVRPGAKLATLGEKIDFLFVDGPPGKVRDSVALPGAADARVASVAPRAGGRRRRRAEDEIEMVKTLARVGGLQLRERGARISCLHAPVLLTDGRRGADRGAEAGRARNGWTRTRMSRCSARDEEAGRHRWSPSRRVDEPCVADRREVIAAACCLRHLNLRKDRSGESSQQAGMVSPAVGRTSAPRRQDLYKSPRFRRYLRDRLGCRWATD